MIARQDSPNTQFTTIAVPFQFPGREVGQPYDRGRVSRLTGLLVKNGPNGSSQCSASVLNSPSGTLILTAAHCVGREAGYVGAAGQQWRFRPAWNSQPADDYSTSVWQSVRAWVPPAFADVGNNQFSDIAIIELALDARGRTIQEAAGAGLTPEFDPSAPFRRLTMYGYPGRASGLQFVCRDSQIQRQGAPANRRGTRLWSPNCATGPGSSGGPWADPATMRVLGTTSTGSPQGGSFASDTTGPQFRNLWNRALTATTSTVT